jgi:hypothetical protein
MGTNKLPDAAHIEGVVLARLGTPRDSYCILQYRDTSGRRHELRVPLLDALHLLNILRDLEAKHPDLKRINSPTRWPGGWKKGS